MIFIIVIYKEIKHWHVLQLCSYAVEPHALSASSFPALSIVLLIKLDQLNVHVNTWKSLLPAAY